MFVPGQHGVMSHHGLMSNQHSLMPGQRGAGGMIGGVSVLLTPAVSIMGTHPTARPILPTPHDEQQFRLRWEQHLSNQQAMFARLLDRGSFCDVALACEGKLINVHKLVLSSSSPYFEAILMQFEKKDPVIILKDIKYETMLALVHFMYKGEVCVDQSKMSEVLEAARVLKVKGLSEEVCDNGLPRSQGLGTSPGAAGLKRPQEMVNHPLAMKKSPRRGRPRKNFTIPTPPVEVAVRKRRRRTLGRPRKVVEEKEEETNEVEKKDASEVVTLEDAESDEEEDGKRIKTNPVEPEVELHCGEDIKSESPPLSPEPTPSDAPIVQLEDYVKRGGTHARYWTEPWVSRVMDAIKRKEMSLQDGANQLGIKYQSLYGRYRVHHGYLITRTSDKPARRNNEDSDNSLSLDCDRSSTCGNDWDPSLNLEPLIQIDMDDDSVAQRYAADQRQRDTRSSPKSNDAPNTVETSSILGL